MTPRQRNQIKAALVFWSVVAETSRVHPMEHPKVQPFFGDGQPTPLTGGEIVDLLASFDMGPYADGIITLRYAVQLDGRGITVDRLRRQISRDMISPIKLEGCLVELYRPCDVTPSLRRIAERDAKQRGRYRVDG